MVNSRKYEKCFSEPRKDKTGGFSALPGKQTGWCSRCDYFNNQLSPNHIEIVMNCDNVVSSAGNTVKSPDGNEGKVYPHVHPFTEIFYWVGTDPNNPEDLGATVEHWLGDGEEAEGIWAEKNSTAIAPGGMTHLPFAVRDLRKPFLTFTILDHPVSTTYRVLKVPSAFKIERKPGDPLPKLKKYAHLYNKSDLSDAPVIPAHKGKSYIALVHDYKQNQNTPHYVRIDMIYGGGIGFGCGDKVQMPHAIFPGVSVQRRSLPVKYPVTAAYCFIPTSDFDHADDLGGTVEFWIGEGAEAEKYTITRPTNVFIPPNTVHMPIYIKETHTPFFMGLILDTPLWTGEYSQKFPASFEHIVDAK
jgi:hypothetical protein